MKTAASALFALAALAVAPAPAAADSPYGSSVAPRNASFSKSEAILGAPSSLAAILASQGAAQPGNAPAHRGDAAASMVPAAARIVPDDRPDVFGSVALPIAHASLERHWLKVGRGALGGTAAAFVDGLDGLGEVERLDAVNRYVNARVAFADDRREFATEDRWLAAADTLRRGRGDCEDYAIAKLQLLRRAGFAEKDLYLVILRDVARRADHAVLVVRADGRLLVLDNGTNRIVDSDSLTDYRPVLTFSGNRRWTHGYRRYAQPTVQMTEAPAQPEATRTAGLAPASGPEVTVSIAF